jgi:hypothetical protein
MNENGTLAKLEEKNEVKHADRYSVVQGFLDDLKKMSAQIDEKRAEAMATGKKDISRAQMRMYMSRINLIRKKLARFNANSARISAMIERAKASQ